MDPRLAALAAAQGGVFTTAQARACGYTSEEVRRLRIGGRWGRVRRGAYAEQALLDRLDASARHRLESDALLLVLQRPAVFSHVTAGAWHGLEMLRPDFGLLHVTRSDRQSSREEGGVHHHMAALPEDQVTSVAGRTVTSLPRTAVDIARESTLPQAVAAVDSALRWGMAREELLGVLEACAQWPGVRTASRAVSFGDGRAANPGESWSRLVLAERGLAPSDVQYAVWDADGLVGEVDVLWESQRTVGEFDGELEYKVPPGADPAQAGQVVWREKRREDRLRERGFEVVRWVWADLFRPDQLAARVRRAFARAAQRQLPA